jgi:hypothetical protein
MTYTLGVHLVRFSLIIPERDNDPPEKGDELEEVRVENHG